MNYPAQPPQHGRTRCFRGAVVVALVCAGGLVAAAPPDGTSVRGPRVRIEPKEIDLGEMVRGDVREARFRILNEGDEVLRIIRVRPG